MESLGPVTSAALAERLAVTNDAIEAALLKLESEGQVMRGRFSSQLPPGDTEWCNRRILARIHRLTLGQLRREIEPVSAAQFQRFLWRWQHLLPGSRLHGVDGTLQIVKQLQGYEISAAAWEPEVLAGRIARYQPEMLDELCLSGEVMWARLSPHPAFENAEPRRVRPTRTAPIAIFLRESAEWLDDPGRGAPVLSHSAREVLTQIEQRGASFFSDVLRATGRLSSEVEDGLWELVAAGLVTADGFENLRSLVDPKRRRGEGRGRHARPRHAAGRWALVRRAENAVTKDERAAAFADQLLLRWGVIFRDLLAR
jgi:ATP-dependent Lhr-like helicase